MTKVVNGKIHIPTPDDVYIGRGSQWGNQASHLPKSKATVRVANLAEALAWYRQWLRDNPQMIARARHELRGKVLVCYCKPKACHGDILARVADGEDP